MNLMNGKPVIGAPRVLTSHKLNLQREGEQYSNIDYAGFRKAVSAAISRGLIVEAPLRPEREPKERKTPTGKRDYAYEFGICRFCGDEFEKIASKSFYCQPCKTKPRPCIVCAREFVPTRAPAKGKMIEICSVECGRVTMQQKKLGKSPANKKPCK